jgi:hypothetical protein
MKHLLLEHIPPLSNEENQLAEQRWSATTLCEVGGNWSQYLVRKAQRFFQYCVSQTLNQFYTMK